MTDKSRDYDQELADIVNALAESTLEMSDEEIELEIREEGLDPKIVTEQVREIMVRLGVVRLQLERPAEILLGRALVVSR